ncbi:rhodanese-like domain-containing protein [Paenibacillus sp. Dod16]|uniref:rhodanese-like domain-containing protein n=1 Tax=Paenibacillus sp. Dod16 TaxID=3416392 RepID=UPI003CE8D52F
MDILNVSFIALIILFVVWRILPAQGVRQITSAQLKQELKDRYTNKQFIDVRTPGEFKGIHIRGTLKKLGFEMVTNVKGGMNRWS